MSVDICVIDGMVIRHRAAVKGQAVASVDPLDPWTTRPETLLGLADVENFNMRRRLMPTSTVNFSVPAEVKQAFNEAFAGEHKSAVIARLMERAIEERQQRLRRAAAIDALLEHRRTQRPVTAAKVAAARRAGRPRGSWSTPASW